MIKVTLDESYIFDMLSILEVKIKMIMEDIDKLKNVENDLKRLVSEVTEQIGPKQLSRIANSKEYKRLYEVNLELYHLVDLAKKDEVKASHLDEMVYERYLAKVALQEKFFGSSPLEVKVGYGSTK